MFGSQGFVRRGDPVEGGGQATQGSGSLVGERPLMLVGDMAECATHGGPFAAVEGYDGLLVDGRRVVLHGHRLACGCRMLSTCNGVWGHAPIPSTRFADTAARAPGPTAAFAPSPQPAPATPVDRLTMESAGPRTGVTLRIALFFDGTNNSASNTALGQQCPASAGQSVGDDEIDREAIAARCKRYMRKDGSSYQNGYTNVWRLHELYRDSSLDGETPQPGGDYFARVYVDGIGTTAGQKDSLLSQGLGGGKAGVVARVQEAIAEQVVRAVDLFVRKYPDLRIDAIEFDVFGFSRGAAAARHFVNQVNRRQNGPLGPVLAMFQSRLTVGFDWRADVRVGFVGLFDTVASIGSLADGLDVRDDDDRGVELALAADCARQVVHLVARDEMRANFMLTTAAPHREIALPGVHSDIGGSYHAMTEGPLWLTKPVGFDEGPVQPGDHHWGAAEFQHSLAWRETAPLLRGWQDRLDIRNPEQLGIDAWEWIRPVRVPGQAAPQPRRRSMPH